MNCHHARKFLYAFADGQLGVETNCEVLDHLKMCSACSRLVDEHQAARAAVGRQLTAVPVPEELRRRVASQLGLSGAAGGLRWRRWRLAGAVLAAAAALVLVPTVVVPLIAPPETATTVAHTASPAVTPEEAESAAAGIARIHRSCVQQGLDHQAGELPASLDGLASAMSSHFGRRLSALAPDLSRYGFRFESANYCGIDGPQSGDGGHIIYASADGTTRLSVFSLPRYARLTKGFIPGSPFPPTYNEFEVAAGGKRHLSVLAWHEAATTYVCCGEIEMSRIKAMVRAVRTAMVDFDLAIRLAMAAPGGFTGVDGANGAAACSGRSPLHIHAGS